MREVSITAKTTASDPHHPLADDAKASLRAELLGQLSASQFAIEAAMSELANADPATRVELRRQLGLIAGLCQQIGTAQGGALASLRSEAAMLIGNTNAAVQEARANAAAGSTSAIGMAMYANTARDQVNAVMAGMKDFDPYLKFASPDEEAEYRRREAERRAYIEQQQARHTPQGDLNAAGGAVGQMADAAVHGAGDSPEFQQRWDKLVASTEELRAQLVREGKDVSEFDARLRNDLRTIMKSKGIPDAQIDALLAAHQDNPLEAVKTFVAEQKGVIGDKEINELTARADGYKKATEEKAAPAPLSAPTPPATIPASALDAMADLKALGVVAAAHDKSAPPAHGVTASVAANLGRGVNTVS